MHIQSYDEKELPEIRGDLSQRRRHDLTFVGQPHGRGRKASSERFEWHGIWRREYVFWHERRPCDVVESHRTFCTTCSRFTVFLDLKLREYLYLFVLGGLRSQNKRLSFVLGGLDFYSKLEFFQLENSHCAIDYV